MTSTLEYPSIREISGLYGWHKRRNSPDLPEIARRLVAVQIATFSKRVLNAYKVSLSGDDINYIVQSLEEE